MKLSILLLAILFIISCQSSKNVKLNNIKLGRIDRLTTADIIEKCKGYYAYMGDTVFINCKDTIILNAAEMVKKCRNVEHDNNNLKQLIPDYRVGIAEIYLVDKQNLKPLHGITKIVYSENFYSIGLYFNGRPFSPFGSPNVITYFKNQKVVLKYIYQNFIWEKKINNSKKHVYIDSVIWDSNSLFTEEKYSIDGEWLNLSNQKIHLTEEQLYKFESLDCQQLEKITSSVKN